MVIKMNSEKIRYKRIICYVILLAFLLSAPASVGFAQEASDAESDLINDGQLVLATTDNGTLAIDKLLYVAFKKFNYHAEFICPIMIEGFNMANSGTCDGVIASKPNLEEEYQNLTKVPVPLEDVNVSVFAREDSTLRIDSWEDLDGLSVGILTNRTYILDQLPDNVSIFTKNTNRRVLEGVVAGEYDVAVLSERSHETLNQGINVMRVGQVDELTSYLYLNKTHEALIPKIQSALKSMFDEGSADRILWDNPMPEINSKKTVIHIVSNNIEFQREKLFRETLNKQFEDDVSIEIKTVNLNIEHSPREHYKSTYVASLLRADCVSRNIAAIVVSGEPALNFLMDYYYLYFRNVPVLFYGVSENYREITNDDEHFTGITDNIGAYQTAEASLSMFPDTKHFYVVNDYTAEGMRYKSDMEAQLEQFNDAVHIEYNENIDCALLMNDLSKLPRDSLVFIGSYFTDASGQYYTLSETQQLLMRYCSVPVFSFYSTDLAYNAVGGNVPDYRKYGETIAEMLREVLSGGQSETLHTITSPDFNIWVFDKDELNRFNVDMKKLPDEAIIINQPRSIWETNPQFIITSVTLFIVFVFTIIGISIFALSRGKNLKRIVALQGELETLLERTQEMNEAKSKFIASISHEMRTPLNAVIGLSALSLDTDELNNNAVINLEKIYSSGMTLLSIVNDLLDISKIESGKFEIVAAEYETPSLINDVITQNILNIGEKPIDFVLNLDADIPVRLYGDVLRVKQIFNNLLSNAFKYTKEGTVKLSVKCYKENDNSVWLIVQAQDTGIGIREEDLSKILTDYVQLNMETSRFNRGVGLGLPITNMLAEMMDGSVNVVSEYGKGSTFTVKFKQGVVTDEVIRPDVLQSLKSLNYSNNKREQIQHLARIQLPHAKVLVVDDVTINLDVMKGVLKPYRMQTDCVTSGQQAIDRVREEKVRYDVIFMDHMMPEIDGIEATRRIRGIGTEYARNVPIIAFTANAVVKSEQMFLNAGFQDFISKPIDINRLDTIIHQWMKNKPRELGDIPAYVKPPPKRRALSISDQQIEGINIQECISHFGGNEELFLEVLTSFVVNTPLLIGKAKKEINKDNLAEYIITIHGIKGSCRTICAHVFAKRAEDLEKAAKSADLDFIRNNNGAYLNDVEKFIADIEKMDDKKSGL